MDTDLSVLKAAFTAAHVKLMAASDTEVEAWRSGNDELYINWIIEGSEELSALENWADQNLITADGSPDIGMIGVLEDEGFRMFAGEKDSFGWLSAIVQYGKLRYVFG